MNIFLKFLYYVVFIFGLSFGFFLVIGLFIDLHGLDIERDGVTFSPGEVVATSSQVILFEQTFTGVVKRGIMSDYLIECGSGIVRLKIHGGSRLDYALFFEEDFYKEIIKKYTPREACLAGGKIPEF